jgi:hypothetical protein
MLQPVIDSSKGWAAKWVGGNVHSMGSPELFTQTMQNFRAKQKREQITQSDIT